MAIAGRVELEDRRQAALDLLARYVRIVDDPAKVEQWPDLFSDQSEYIVITRENFARGLPIAVIRDDSKDRIIDRVTIIREFWGAGGRAEDRHYNNAWPRHIVGPVWVDVSGSDVVRLGANFAVYQTFAVDESPRLLAVGEYQDEIAFSGSTPKFKSKIVILDTSVLQDVFVYPL